MNLYFFSGVAFVNHAGFDDVRKNLLDNGCHHQKGGEYKCMNTYFDDAKV